MDLVGHFFGLGFEELSPRRQTLGPNQQITLRAYESSRKGDPEARVQQVESCASFGNDLTPSSSAMRKASPKSCHGTVARTDGDTTTKPEAVASKQM